MHKQSPGRSYISHICGLGMLNMLRSLSRKPMPSSSMVTEQLEPAARSTPLDRSVALREECVRKYGAAADGVVLSVAAHKPQRSIKVCRSTKNRKPQARRQRNRGATRPRQFAVHTSLLDPIVVLRCQHYDCTRRQSLRCPRNTLSRTLPTRVLVTT